jgi:hypothetical protein
MTKEYYEKNKEAILLKRKEYKQRNKEKIKEQNKIYREKNKEKIAEKVASKKYPRKELTPEEKESRRIYLKEYKLKNAEKLKVKNKEYNDANKEKRKEYLIKNVDKIKKKKQEYNKLNKKKITERKKVYYSKNKEKLIPIRNKKLKELYDNNPLHKLKVVSRNITRKAIVNNGYSKKTRTFEILGCSFEEFKTYLESKFESWMTWENYGKYNGELNYGWDIDHRVPLSTATTEDELLKLLHFSNCQPLCSKINRDIKRDRLDY